MFEEVYAEFIGNWVEVVHLNVIQHEIVHNDLGKIRGYVDKQSSLEVLLSYLKLDP